MSELTVSTMTAQQRVKAAVNKQAVDRAPVTAWIHFGSEHLSPAETAALHLRFAETYQPDLLKIHADYRLTVSESDDLRGADDLLQIGRLAVQSPCFVLQKPLVSAVLDSPSNHSVVMDTVFSPFQNLLRNVGSDQLAQLLKYTQQTEDTLNYIADATCEHLRWLQSNGVGSCYFATHAAMAAENYSGLAREWHAHIVERWIQPFDKQVLAAAAGMTRILHAHGQALVLQRLSAYEFEVLHLSTESPGNPALTELRQWTDKCLMGGISETGFSGLSLAGLSSRAAAAVAEAGDRGFILAPGCSLPPHTPARLLRRLFGFSAISY